MSTETVDFSRLEPDVLELFSRQIIAMAPGLEAAILEKKAEFCQEFGGQRYYLPKGAKRMTDAQRDALYQDGLTSMTNEELQEKHKVSRRTIYNAMKKGGRFGGGQ
jgi:Mor family transcriptional regulator